MHELNTSWGKISIEKGHWGGADTICMHDNEDVVVRISAPDRRNPERRAEALLVDHGIEFDEDVSCLANLSRFAIVVCSMINECNREDADRLDREMTEREEAALAKRLEDETQNAEREERLLQEFIGDEVRIRHRSYKTMCYATVEARPTSWGIAPVGNNGGGESVPTEYGVKMRYKYQGQTRDFGVRSFARVDVKTPKGWKSIWDDGVEDLSESERADVLKREPKRELV